MILKQCENGHYYDPEKNKSCPWCKSEDIDTTILLSPDNMQYENGHYYGSGKNDSSPWHEPEDTVITIPVSPDNMQYENGHYYGSEKNDSSPWHEPEESDITIPVSPDNMQYENGQYYGSEKNDSSPWHKPEDIDDDTTSIDPHYLMVDSTDAFRHEEESFTEPVTGWLVATTGPHRGQDFRIVQERNFLGRGELNQICLSNDPEVSRNNHCSVIYDPRSGKFVVLAGNSTATKLNNETLLSSAELHDGDILSMGKTDLCFISFCREGRNWK